MTDSDTAALFQEPWQANLSELDLLRQRNAELEAELEIDRGKIDKLKKTIRDLSSENFDLKREVAKLREELGNRIEELEKNKADNDVENAELKVRVAKLEQGNSTSEAVKRVTSSKQESRNDNWLLAPMEHPFRVSNNSSPNSQSPGSRPLTNQSPKKKLSMRIWTLAKALLARAPLS